VETDASLAPELAVAVYTGTNPWLFPALGLLGVIGTLAFEKWADGDGSATLAVVAMAAVVYIYLDTPPHQPIRSLIGAILLGSILGVPVAMLLWRFIPRRWIARHA
jgi:RsiW-degrading membrane proteinase PrsW (M82 family)